MAAVDIHFEVDNDAFLDEDGCINLNEVERVMEKATKKLLQIFTNIENSLPLQDSNGHTIGSVIFTDT